METVDLFILTEEWLDTSGRMVLRYIGLSDKGPVEVYINNSYPVFFIEQSADISMLKIPYKKKEVELKTYEGIPVTALYFRTQGDLRRAAELLDQNNISTYESDVDPARRFLMEKNIFSQMQITGEAVNTSVNSETGSTSASIESSSAAASFDNDATSSSKSELTSGSNIKKYPGRMRKFINPKITPGEYTPSLKIVSLDIETGQAGQLYSIAVHLTHTLNNKEQTLTSAASIKSRVTLDPHEEVKDVFMLTEKGKEGNHVISFTRNNSFQDFTANNKAAERKAEYNDTQLSSLLTDNDEKINLPSSDKEEKLNLPSSDKELYFPSMPAEHEETVNTQFPKTIHDTFGLSYFSSEADLINAFTTWIRQHDPDVIIGWHVIGFDLTFLQNKAKDLGVPFNLSRNGRFSIYLRKGGRNFTDITGRVVVDGPTGLRSAFYSFDDYRLDTVAAELLGYGKTIKSTSTEKVAEIENNFSNDKLKLAEYNMMDAVLVSEIFKKTELLNQYIKRSQLSGLPFDKLAMMTAAFDHFYLPKLHKEGYVACNVRDVEPHEPAAGGYVLDPIPGIYENVIVLDFKSLYPTIIQTFKIDPVSQINHDVDTITTPAGFKFSRTKNYLPDFIGSLLQQRSYAKKSGDVHLSQAIKILMNSFYGVMGSMGCRFYHPDLPSGITSTGHFLLLNSKTYLEQHGYKVLYGDTDSLFVKITPTVSEETPTGSISASSDLFIQGKQIAEDLNIYWKQRLKEEFKVESYIEIEFEKVFRKFVLTPARGSEAGAKKRYAGLLIKGDKEKIEFTGLENVRSDWTPLAKEFQSELYRRIFYNEEYHAWMNELVRDLKAGKLDHKLVYTKRLRKESEEYVKNIPPQVKAARMLNTNSSRISYVITKKGPIPVELNPTQIDYQHYIEKQLQPLADSVLVLLGESFEQIIGTDQLSIF